jgi:predicted O-methyltransferase YrrM
MLEIKDLGAGSALNSAGALREGTPAAGALHGVEPASGASRGMEGHGIAEGNGRVVHRRVSDLARHAAKSEKLGKLLFRIARYYDPGLILELGTSLGLSTAYLATGGKHAGVVTIEGAEAVAAVAAQNLQSLGLGAVEVVKGNFDDVLIPTLSKKMPADLAFIDGNHRKEPTIRYFNLLMDRMSPASILIFDDIHWSQEMEAAWEVIKQDPRVYLTVDLFFTGLVFLRSEFKVKQHFTIRF